MELKPYGINVTALCPGFTRTEFHEVMGTEEDASRLPEVLWQQPDDVVREGWEAVNGGKAVRLRHRPGRQGPRGQHAARPVARAVHARAHTEPLQVARTR